MAIVNLPAGVTLTPAILKQIIEQCGTCNPCGSGSGSGSGNGSGGFSPDTSCGGCDWGAISSLNCSVYISCLAQTFTFSLSGGPTSECILYTGSTTYGSAGTGNDFTCSGVPTSLELLYETDVSVELFCRKCNEVGNDCTERTIWTIAVTFNSVKGGVRYGGQATNVLGVSRMTLLSCDPAVFAQKRIDYICLPVPLVLPTQQECCNLGDVNLQPPYTSWCHDYGSAQTQATDGCYVEVDISV